MFLESKHQKYKELRDEEKLNYTKNEKTSINVTIETEDSE